jgi:hypothetical protein
MNELSPTSKEELESIEGGMTNQKPPPPDPVQAFIALVRAFFAHG